MRLRRILAINMMGRLTSILITMVALPIYLHLVGIQAVGLIGFYNTMLALLGVFEHVVGSVVMREPARLATAPNGGLKQRDFLRTAEALYATIAVLLAAAVAVGAPWIGHTRLTSSQLPQDRIILCLMLMGPALALQLLFGLHVNLLNCLERSGRANLLVILLPAVRVGSAILVLIVVSRTPEAYFITQIAAVAVCLGVSFFLVWSALPKGPAPRVRLSLLRESWVYIPTLFANAALFVVITNIDKVIVSALLPLEVLGIYVIASSVASLFWAILTPVHVGLLPRFSVLLKLQAENDIRQLYHTASNLLAVMIFPAAVITLLFPLELLILWTGDMNVAETASALVRLLCFGTILMSLLAVPNALQLAAGWPHFAFYTNLLGVLWVPVAATATFYIGAYGPASILPAVAMVHFIITPLLMHRRLLRAELWRWYLVDLGWPFAAATAIGVMSRMVFEPSTSRLQLFVQLTLVWGLATLAAVFVSPGLRRELVRFARHFCIGSASIR